MNFKKLKVELFYLRKSISYKKGWEYFYNKFIVVPKILKTNKVLEKPITHDGLSVHVLTSRRDLLMLIWSLASFYDVSEVIGKLFIHNDGSFEEKDEQLIHKFFPNATIVNSNNFIGDYADELDLYPAIKEFRKKSSDFVLLKKIIDPYFVSQSPCRLIIDSDLLWFKQPQEIEDEFLSGCKKSLMMSTDTYCPVYFKNGEKLSKELSEFNSGIVLYHKDNFDINKLISYFESLDMENIENRHFIEQAGYSSTLLNLEALPQDRYIIKGAVGEGTVMRHYTSPRRMWLFIEGIKILKKYVKNLPE